MDKAENFKRKGTVCLIVVQFRVGITLWILLLVKLSLE